MRKFVALIVVTLCYLPFAPISFGQTSSSMFINGHQAVDLGLSVKWATCNVGANRPDEYGDYFGWGETSTKESYDKENSVSYGVFFTNIASQPKYDVARATWGGSWRLPTTAELIELGECDWQWTTVGGQDGYKIIGPNGNSIFLPAAGHIEGAQCIYPGYRGYYWSSSAPEPQTYSTSVLVFSDGVFSVHPDVSRYLGQSVRPVSD